MTGPLFTFDDGPSEWTPKILDLLRHEGAPSAIFFVTGHHSTAHQGTLRRIVTDGHQIGNHGWTHRRLTDLTDSEIEMELRATEHAVRKHTGETIRAWRAPYFGRDERVDGMARWLGYYPHQGASLIPDDWCATDPEALAAVILDELQPDSVVSLHDGVPPDGGSERCTQTRDVTVEALRIVLAGMVRA